MPPLRGLPFHSPHQQSFKQAIRRSCPVRTCALTYPKYIPTSVGVNKGVLITFGVGVNHAIVGL